MPLKAIEKILDTRNDLSDYLFHFTKREDGKQTLEKILGDEKLIASEKSKYICFTEAPLHSMTDMFNHFSQYKNPMYAPYGVAILKEDIYDLGGRHVIYGPNSDLEFIDSTIHWRFEEYDPTTKDFTWLREWRVREDFIELDAARIFVITKLIQEEDDMSKEEGEIDIDGCVSDGQFWPSYYLTVERKWSCISLERLIADSLNTRIAISENLDNQQIGELEYLYLGSG